MDEELDRQTKPAWKKLGTIGAVVLGILALVFANGIGKMIGRTTVDNFRSGYNESSRENLVRTGIEMAVAQIRKQVPVHVDNITTLRDAIASDKEIIYLMEVDSIIDTSQLTAAKISLENQNKKNVCSDEKTRKLIEAGGIMTWQYTLQDGLKLRVSVTECNA